MSNIRVLAVLIVLAAPASAQGPRARRVALPRLWVSAEVPPGWRPRLRQNGFMLPPLQGRETPAVSVSFEEGDDSALSRRLRGLMEVPDAVLRARGATEFHSGALEHRGAWTLGETSERGRDGRARRDLHAAIAAPGGWYLVETEAEEDSFARLRADVLRLLDTFERAAPPLPLAAYADPGGLFTVLAPTAPWRASPIPAGSGADFLGADGPEDQPRALISIQRITRGGRYPDADAYAREETRPADARKSAPAAPMRTAAGTWRRFETNAVSSEGSPESAPRATRLITAHAVLQRDKDLFVLTLQAPPASYDDYRAAFDRVVASFRPLDRDKN